jgi:ankyrin repeat protein
MDIFARIMAQDIENYQRLIDKVPINTTNENDASMLQIAVAYGSQEIALDLVRRGINIDRTTPRGQTTELQDALVLGLWRLAVELINHGADIHHRDAHGNNALWYAATHPGRNDDIVRMLVERGSDMLTKNQAGRSALDAARERGDKELIDILQAGI